MQPYTERFYQDIKVRSRRSAKEITPLVLELIQPRSVIDVGCGVGTWLSVFKKFGVDDIFGVDGDWIDKKMLEISEERFLSFDLTTPLRIDKQFDLVVSLEVAEHLPGECAEMFVESLTRLGPVILFSAAIPFQGGTHHVNEQWPEYWVKFFRDRGYMVIDCIRKKIWQNDNVEWFYAQNILMFVRWDYLENHPLLKKEFENTSTCQLSIVHPNKYLEVYRFLLTTPDILALIPPGDSFILVDNEVFRGGVTPGRKVVPFLERDGRYWGPPPDDSTAIRELERLRRTGARFIVFAWPAFWWFDYYAEFYRYLLSNFSCVLQNERIEAFDLRS